MNPTVGKINFGFIDFQEKKTSSFSMKLPEVGYTCVNMSDIPITIKETNLSNDGINGDQRDI